MTGTWIWWSHINIAQIHGTVQWGKIARGWGSEEGGEGVGCPKQLLSSGSVPLSLRGIGCQARGVGMGSLVQARS